MSTYDGLPAGYDAWKLNPTQRHFTGRCGNCDTEYESDSLPELDEDGMPDLRVCTRPCAGCGAELCEACTQHACEYCLGRLCEICATYDARYPGYFCSVCHANFLEVVAAEAPAESEAAA